MRRFPASFALLAALAAASACGPTATGGKEPAARRSAPPPARGAGPSTATTGAQGPIAAQGALTGVARSPARLLANNGGSLITDNGAGLVSNNGGGVVANNGGSVVANNGGGVVANNGASYALRGAPMPFVYGLADAALVPVPGAQAVLVDGFRRPVPGVAPVVTDAQGRFGFAKVPAGTSWVVEVRLPGFKLAAIADGRQAVDVTPASTIVTEHLRTALDERRGALRVVAPEAVARLTDEVERTLARGDVRVDLSTRATAAQTFEQIVGKAPALAAASREVLVQALGAAEAAVAAGTLQAADLAGPAATDEALAPQAVALDLAAAQARIAPIAAARGIGAPWDLGQGAGAHAWHGVAVQRFYGGPETEAHCMIVDGPQGPKLVRNEFYNSYVSGGLYWTLGAPIGEDEVLQEPQTVEGRTFGGPSVRQRFERGFLMWTEGSNVVAHVPGATPTVRPAYAEVRYPPQGLDGARVATLAGGEQGEADGPGDAARFTTPTGLAAAPDGTLVVADRGNGRLRRVGLGGRVTTFAGADGQPLAFVDPAAVAVAPDGTIYVAAGHRVWRVRDGAAPTPVAGGDEPGTADGPGASARFARPQGLAVGKDGTVYVADTDNDRIRAIAPDGTVRTHAGGAIGFEDGKGPAAKFKGPHGLAVDGGGTLYVADSGNHAIRRVSPGGEVLLLTGVTGQPGRVDGSGRPTYQFRPPAAAFDTPVGVALDPDGDLYVTEREGHAVRKITFGTATSFTLAGVTRTAGFADGPGDAARLSAPAGLAVDAIGQIYLADAGNHRIRKVVPQLQFTEAR